MSNNDALVSASHLEKKFGDFTAVGGIDVQVRRGEAFGFLGPNGAGKSSTMRMIACVSPRTGGDLSVLGMDPDRQGPQIRARIGVVPQGDILDGELTVRQNLEVYGRYFGLPRAHVRAKATELLEFAQLTEKADAEVEALSGGMKRRLTIARSLVNDPELLLLDEPTTGLDPQARHLLWDRLFRLKQRGATLIITTHYMDEAEQLCDRLVVMDHGTIVAEGAPSELIRSYSTREVLELRFPLDDAAARRARPSSRASPTGSRCCPTGCCSTPTTARPRSPPRTSGACARCPAWSAAAASRTCSCASPAEAWWTDMATVDTGRIGRAGSSLRASMLVVEGHWTWYKRNWKATVVSSVGLPILYLLAMGLGFGSQVRPSAVTGGVSYLQYLTPALIAMAATQTGAGDATFPVLSGFKWQKHYIGMSATPITPSQIADAVFLWITFRLILSCGVFLAVAAAIGAVTSPMVLLSLVFGILTGLAFAAPGRRVRRVGQGRGQRVQPVLPLRARADDVVRWHVLPGQLAASGDPADRLDHPALARHRTGQGRGVRHAATVADHRARRLPARVDRGRDRPVALAFPRPAGELRRRR